MKTQAVRQTLKPIFSNESRNGQQPVKSRMHDGRMVLIAVIQVLQLEWW